jgi:methyl-accepting chemotaxis protein
MMKRLIPDSIASRTLAVLLVGLTLSHVLGMALYFTDRTSALLLTGGEHLAERVATITRIVERTPQADRPRIVELADRPKFRVTWNRNSALDNERVGGWQSSMLRTALLSHFEDLSERNFRIQYGDAIGTADSYGKDIVAADDDALLVSVQLPDQSWLNFAAPDRSLDPFWSYRFVLSMEVMIAAVFVLSTLVVYHLVTPLRRFAQAAQRLGVDVNAPPLSESGPREVRQASHAFNEMQGRIRRFVEDRTQMLAAVSHDLRTPIMRLRLRAEFIEDDEQRQRTLADLDEMERMVASTLSFARDDAAREAPEAVDLVALVQRVCDGVEDASLPVEFEGEGRLA